MSRRARELDWDLVARAGDAGLAAPFGPAVPAVSPSARRRRPRKWTLALLVVWLAWEAGGVVRAAIIGPPILKAMWSVAP